MLQHLLDFIMSPWVQAGGFGLFLLGYTWVTKVDNTDYVAAAHINTLQTEKLDRDGGVPLTAGLKFPATAVPSADVNTLDDYEEGTWTPVRNGFTEVVGGGSITNTGYYTKVGRLVFITAIIACAGGATIAADPGVNLSGAPFAESSPTSGTWANVSTATTGGGVLFTGSLLFIVTGWAAASHTWTMNAVYWV